MKNQKGIALTKLIIIIAVIILGIVFVVKMSEPQDGILSVEEAQEKYNKTLQEKEKIDKEYQDALENVIQTKETLERLEKNYK